jgi:hypothetical protein
MTMLQGYTYSSPLVLTYKFPSHDFGAGADTRDIKGPPGMKGRLVNTLLYNVTEAFTADTTPAYIRVGTTGDADLFNQTSCATTAIDGVVSDSPDEDTYNVQMAADAIVRTSFVAPTGGTPAGIGEVQIAIAWYF